MKKTGLDDVIIYEICDIARKYDVDRVILFGSRARGNYQRASDIDLAVSGGNITHFALDIEEETSTPLKYDVIDLNKSISKQLLESIHSEGIILYEKI